MRVLVVYYSLEGNTKYVAEQIAGQLGADVLRLEPVKDYPSGKTSKYFWGGKSVVFGEKPKLKTYQFQKEDYDIILLGTPVWAGSYTPPLKTFLHENDLSGIKIGLFTCSAGEAEKCILKMKKDLKISGEIPVLSLIEPTRNNLEDSSAPIAEFCKKIIEEK